MTREQARSRQAEIKTEIDYLTIKHIELLEAASMIYRDIAAMTDELDIVDSRLEYDGTSFTGPQNVRTIF
jgi:hypothetical protein